MPPRCSILFTTFEEIDADHIRPFLAIGRAGQNDRDNLLAYHVSPALLTAMLNALHPETDSGTSTNEDVVFTVVSGIGGEGACGFQGRISSGQFGRVLRDTSASGEIPAALDRVVRYLNLNFWSGSRSAFRPGRLLLGGLLLLVLYLLWRFVIA